MIKRRTIIAVVVFIMGTAVYLMASDAPARVHIVTIAAEFCLFAVVTFFLCMPSMKAVLRVTGAAFGVTVVVVISTWLSSKVIAALNPLEAIYFVIGLIGFVVQAITFAGVVWTIDFGIKHAWPHNTASEGPWSGTRSDPRS